MYDASRIASPTPAPGRIGDPSEIALGSRSSKQKTTAEILEAVEAGLRHLGENRVEEGEEKIPQVNDACGGRVVWHMVGHVQSRKAKRVVSCFDTVQSVDSLKRWPSVCRVSREKLSGG